MADETSTGAPDASEPAAWQGRWASAVALVGAIILIGLLTLVTLTNRDRDAALALERNVYESMHLVRAVDGSIARAEAAMGRYVLDLTRESGTFYYQEWRRAGHQIGQLRDLVRDDPEQVERVDQLRQLFNRRGEELARAATAASRREGMAGIGLFYSAAQSDALELLQAQLDAIERAGRETLNQRVRARQAAADRADRFMQWLGWVAVAISLLAIVLSYWAYRAFAEGRIARSRADLEAERSSELERAVSERTKELSTANERLQAEMAERAAAEEKLRQVQKMEAVGQLTGGIAHDFNNMLAVVVGGLDLAKRRLRTSPREAEAHIDSALEGATRASALTRRLLTFARAEPLLPEAIAPSTLVNDMLELIDRTIGERIRVHTSFPDEPWHVWADQNGLENAILNLCVNARDAMEETGDLTIEVANVTLGEGEVGSLDAGEYVRVTVADTGRGIAPEHLQRVFEPFFTTKPVGKGTGLGLSQIFGFARQSGGDITLQSELGRGTSVSIYLPRAVGVTSSSSAPRGVFGHAEEVQPALHSGRILVVEDDPRVSRSTVSALQELGHRPHAVSSGAEALQVLAEEGGFDLVITDVVMPNMTGVELAREVGRTYPGLGILFVTGYVGEAGTLDELGGRPVLRKPFTVAQLAAAVETAMARRDGYDAAAE
ncbi:MAG: ATP-binding protein [Allosphingosinicella sp.]|uniref:hybrid sensor histidine kinase/response regulator n=1 Tax=Allosphingosinicella sp. TaxID=2823234 RepID=UPI0039376C54